MKKMNSLLKYQWKQYLNSYRYVMPILVLFGFLAMNYSVKPAHFVACVLISCNFLFLNMVWVGYTITNLENEISEQIMVLRVQSDRLYYVSQWLFLMFISVCFSMISVGCAVLVHVRNGCDFFFEHITFSLVFSAFWGSFLCAFAGATLGGLGHKRIVKDQKISLVFLALLTVLSIVKMGVLEQMGWTRYLFWILPPISDFSKRFTDKLLFGGNDLGIMTLWFLVWILIVSAIKVCILQKKKFG